jgi:hypothetical protein
MNIRNRVYKYIGKIIYALERYYFIDLKKNSNPVKWINILPKRVFYNRRTPLCEIMEKNGSDKGGFAGIGMHNYTTVYYELFKDSRHKKIYLFELGIGTRDESISSNMGFNGLPGASLRGWCNFFSKGEIYSADIDKSVLFQEERIKSFFCDQTNPEIIKKMWFEIDDQIIFDYIIDDGLHEFHANLTFFLNSIHRLKKGGIYIIEDIHENEIKNWEKYVKNNNDNYKFLLIRLPNRFNNWDNNMMVIQKI